MERVFENLINGDLTDARFLAERFSMQALESYAVNNLGWTCRRASYAASYLKHGGQERFQRYCDSVTYAGG